MLARRMAGLPHAFAINVEPGDIDMMGHVNNAIYLKWVQDAVVAHWHRFATPAAVDAHVWIALKHEITYRKPAFLHDPVVATVTLEQVRRESAFYDTIVSRGKDVLATVKSRWCCLDATTLRPKRVADDIIRRFLPLPPEPADRAR